MHCAGCTIDPGFTGSAGTSGLLRSCYLKAHVRSGYGRFRVGTLLVVLATALFIASIVVLVVAFRRPKTAKPGAGRQDPLSFNAMPQFGPRSLGPGAIVSYGGVDYVVRGSVTYREGPFVWWEHLLEGGDQPLWFSVEDDDGRLELAMWAKRADLVQLQPDGQHVVDGVTFQESERGHAGYTTRTAVRSCSESSAHHISSPSITSADASPNRSPAPPAARARRCPSIPTHPAITSNPAPTNTTRRHSAGSRTTCATVARPKW